MATKDRSQWSAAYLRRIESAERRGKTRQQARGHKVKEHIIRREKEIEKFGLSTSQMRSIRQWRDRYKNLDFPDADDIIEHVQTEGWDWFVNYRDTWAAERRWYKNRNRQGQYASRGLGYLENLSTLIGTPDISWLYYH